jgi:hypothetical protein
VWGYTHLNSPIASAIAAGASQIIFYANLSAWFRAQRNASGGALDDVAAVDTDCCTLVVGGGASASAAYPELSSLHVPPLQIARLLARNTGVNGGYARGDSIEHNGCMPVLTTAPSPPHRYARGDSIELTLRTRTDRAGFAVGEMISRDELDELLVFSPATALGPDERAVAGVWRDACTLLLVAGNGRARAPCLACKCSTRRPLFRTGNTTGLEHAPRTAEFTVRLRDDVHELKDARRRLQTGSVAVSPPLEGTFGAAEGYAGRSDPLRAVLHENAVRRFEPPPAHASAHHGALSSPQVRRFEQPPAPYDPPYGLGPLPWHTPIRYDPTRNRSSECDADYIHSPDALMKHAEYEGGEYVRERTLPTWSLDEASRELIRQALVFLARRPERLTPYRAPLDDLPDTARLLDGRWSDLDVTSRQGFASSAGAHPTRRPQGPTRIVIDDRFVGRALSEDEMARGVTRLRSYDYVNPTTGHVDFTLPLPGETPEGDEFYWTRTVLQTHHAAETPGDSFEGSPRSRIFGHPDPRWPSLLETAPEVAVAIAAHNPRDAERVL